MIEYLLLAITLAILILVIELYFRNKQDKTKVMASDNNEKGKELARKYLLDEIKKNHDYLYEKQNDTILLYEIINQMPVKLDRNRISITEWQKIKYEIADVNPKLATRLSKLYDFYINIITADENNHLSNFKDYDFYHHHIIVNGLD